MPPMPWRWPHATAWRVTADDLPTVHRPRLDQDDGSVGWPFTFPAICCCQSMRPAETWNLPPTAHCGDTPVDSGPLPARGSSRPAHWGSCDAGDTFLRMSDVRAAARIEQGNALDAGDPESDCP